MTKENTPTPDSPPAHGESGTQEHEHPRGLYTLFGAEAWERFSYYGMRALLVLYMTNHLAFDRKNALAVYALYTGLVYLTPIAGGYFADKFLGRRKAVLIGGITMGLGHLAMAFEPLLYLALGLLIVGNGFFKPNISTIVGGLYEEGDPRRDGGFTIFYMGINLGAFFSPIICGNLGEKVSWHFGFSAAAIGMTFGLIQFVLGQKYFGRVGLPPRKAGTKVKEPSPPYRPTEEQDEGSSFLVGRDYADVAIWVVAAVGLVYSIVHAGRAITTGWVATPLILKIAGGAAVLAAIFYQLFKNSTKDEAQRIAVIVILSFFNIFFWMGFEQAGGTMTLFADKQTDRLIGGAGVIATGAVMMFGAFNIRRATTNKRSYPLVWLGQTISFAGLSVAVVAFIFWYGAKNAGTGSMTLPISMFGAAAALMFGGFAVSRRQSESAGPQTLWIGLTLLFVLGGFAIVGYGGYLLSTGGKTLVAASQFQAINPLLIVVLAPTFSNLWTRLDSNPRTKTSTPTKMAIGMIILGLGFVVMYIGQKLAATGPVSPLWLCAVYALHTTGELCLSPIGLSMVTKLAPVRVVSLAMGLWFFSSFVANTLAGLLEGMLEDFHVPLYGFLIFSSIFPAILLMALTPLLKKWMHGRA